MAHQQVPHQRLETLGVCRDPRGVLGRDAHAGGGGRGVAGGTMAALADLLRRALDSIDVHAPAVPLFMGTSGKRETDPAEIKRLLVEQADSLERHFDAVWAAHDAGCRNFLEVAHKPQPVTWLGDQLQGEDGALMPGVTPFAVRTEEI